MKNDQNRLLLESSTPVVIYERTLSSSSTHAESARANKHRAAKVGQGKMNANERVYVRAAWAKQIERAKELIAAGRLGGAVDHAGWSNGNLKDSCIMWNSLSMEADGAVVGEFSIVKDHSRGRDLQAQIDGGMTIGFSTVSRAVGREPTPTERELYAIPDDADCPVIIEEFELLKIDAVDNPSVEDAWLRKESRAALGEMVAGEFFPENILKERTAGFAALVQEMANPHDTVKGNRSAMSAAVEMAESL